MYVDPSISSIETKRRGIANVEDDLADQVAVRQVLVLEVKMG